MWLYGRKGIGDGTQRLHSALSPEADLLPPGSVAVGSSRSSRIFVGIPSYRDPQLLNTIRHLFAQAHMPERVRVEVVQKLSDYDASSLDANLLHDELRNRFKTPRGSLRVITLPAHTSRGVVVARSLVEKLRGEEEFTLWVDNHTRFAEKWDELMLNQLYWAHTLQSTRDHQFQGVLVSTYPPNYWVDDPKDPQADPTQFAVDPTAGVSSNISLVWFKQFGRDGLPRFAGCRSKVPEQYVDWARQYRPP
eukprot:gb/GECG01010812.1/.p1 GENE.gb/GECG01010812.1/~~gb/GECG01010812.1/.p1  ORF type:complete len:249 (+),score=11.28 gb/GECG01010812.1/:1-747(+)